MKKEKKKKEKEKFVGISRTCSKICILTDDCRKIAEFWEMLVKFPELIEKCNRKLQYFIRLLSGKAGWGLGLGLGGQT